MYIYVLQGDNIVPKGSLFPLGLRRFDEMHVWGLIFEAFKRGKTYRLLPEEFRLDIAITATTGDIETGFSFKMDHQAILQPIKIAIEFLVG